MATILIVDDEPHIRELVALILDRHTVLSAPDGIAALELLRQQKPDLIILDVMMPKLNGYEVLHRIRSDPLLRGFKVAMLSAKVQEQDREQAKSADYYLHKPFDPTDFERRIEEMLVP